MPRQHGGLAKVGKVKKHTPIVEPNHDKKNPRGRAKKRSLYQRRYVNGLYDSNKGFNTQ